MPVPESEQREQLLTSFINEIYRTVVNSAVSESFSGVPEDVRPSLSIEDLSAEEQLVTLLREFLKYLTEAARRSAEEIKVPNRYQDVYEETGQTFTRFRAQFIDAKRDARGWLPQLWISELAVIEDNDGNENPDRIDRVLRAEVSGAAERYRRLSETDVPRAATEKEQLEKRIAHGLYTPFEETRIMFQMSHPAERQVRPLIGLRIQRCHAGYQVWPIFVMGGRREIVDMDSPLLGQIGIKENGLTNWMEAEKFRNSVIGSVLKEIVEKILTQK